MRSAVAILLPMTTAEGAGGPWPGTGNELRPFRPSDAKAARQRRSSSAGTAAGDDHAWLEHLSTDLLEHVSILSEVVISTTDGTREHLRALSTRVTALATAVDALLAEVRELRETQEGPPVLAADDLDALAGLVADRLRTALPTAPPRRGRS